MQYKSGDLKLGLKINQNWCHGINKQISKFYVHPNFFTLIQKGKVAALKSTLSLWLASQLSMRTLGLAYI